MTISEQLDWFEAGTVLLPFNEKGNEAALTVKQLINAVHTAEYCEVPRIIGQIRSVFQEFNITIE